jgi:hypothetical protein
LAIADRHMTSWQEWHYCGCSDPTTSGPGDKQAIVIDPAKPPEGANLKTKTLDAVTRPFPQAVAGTPESWSFDPSTRAFSLRYTTARAGGGAAFGAGAETEVAAPARQYPNGYAARVQGGRILSAPRDPVLRFTACAGVTRVGVDLSPGTELSSTCKPPAAAARTRLRVSVSPRRVRAGHRVTLRFRVRAGTRGVRHARVTVAGRRVLTDRRGRAAMRIRFGRTGRRAVAASARGYRSGRATVRVLRSARFTG